MPEKSFNGGLFATTEDCVLGIDPSLTGFAVTALSLTSPAYQTWVYRSEYRGVERLHDIQRWLESRIWHLNRTRSIKDVAIEGGVVQSQASFILGELAGVIKVGLFHLPVGQGRYPLQVPPMSLKKYVAGKGNGVKKNQMLLATYKRWGAEFTDDNASDSFGLAQIVKAVHLGQVGDVKYQVEVLMKLNDPKFRDTRHDPTS
jgi:Holliday junction resolvasome RuvABC endonuclease subunit